MSIHDDDFALSKDELELEVLTCQNGLEPTIRRWQELEPERCLYHEDDLAWLVHDQQGWQGIGRYGDSPKLFGMVAAAAARSSLLRRGWSCGVDMGWEGGSAFVFVEVADAQGERLACKTGPATSFDDLTVQSYVTALDETTSAKSNR